MTDEQPQEQKNVITPKSIWKQLLPMEIAIMVLMVGFIVYLRTSTSLVPNLNTGNETRIINGIQNPPKTILYPSNSFVPKAPVSNTEMIIGIFLVIVMAIIFKSRQIIGPKRATQKEAMDDISKQIKLLKNIPLADGTSIPITDKTKIILTPQFMTRYRFMSGMENKPEFRYTFLVYVKDEMEGLISYFRAWYHPWTRYWDGFYEAKKSLSDRDRCYYCGGSEYDIIYIGTEDVQKFRELRRQFGGVTRI